MKLRSGKRKKTIIRKKFGKKKRLDLSSTLREHQRFLDSCVGFLETSEESLIGFEMNHDPNAGACGVDPTFNHPPSARSNKSNNPPKEQVSEAEHYLQNTFRISPDHLSVRVPVTSSATCMQPRSSLNRDAPSFALPQNQLNNYLQFSALSENNYRNPTSQVQSRQAQLNSHLSEMLSQPSLNFPSTSQPNNSNSDNDSNITRLERMISSLAINVNTLNERFNSFTRVNPTQRSSVPGISPNPLHAPPPPNNVTAHPRLSAFENLTAAPNNQLLNIPQFPCNLRNGNVYRTLPHKWRVKYTGDNNVMSVEFFLDQLTVLKESSVGTTWEEVLAVFPQFLEGDAARWFIRFRKKIFANNQQITWAILKKEMLIQFRGAESEVSLWCKLVNRKQGERESFDKFLNAILDLHDRIPVPFSDIQIIGILKNNVKLDIQRCLVTYSTTNLTDFVNKCRETEFLFHHNNLRKVSELEVENNDTAGEIEAFVKRTNTKSSSTVNIKCWNCDFVGHDWKVCEKPLTIFCYWCGLKDYKCRDCPKCNSSSQNFRQIGRNHDPPPSAPPMENH